jgi:Flp pilus assembly protein TadB
MRSLRSRSIWLAVATAAIALLFVAPGTRATITPATKTTKTVPTTPPPTKTVTTTVTTTVPAPASPKPKPTVAKKPAAKPKKPAAKPKKPVRKRAKLLTGTLGSGATFPERTLVLTVPPGQTATAAQVSVTENGQPVSGLSVTPLSQARAGDFGVFLVIDQSPSMRGKPLAQAMVAARALAAQRVGAEALGAITFDATPNLILPLTSDRTLIDSVLSTTPSIAPGTRILPAVTMALKLLAAAKVATGGVILLSDGDDWEQATTLTPQSVTNLARTMGFPIYTVGLKDHNYYPNTMQELARLGRGKFIPASAAQLPRVFTSIAAGLRDRYLVRYRSPLSAGQQVSVVATVNGIAGRVDASYRAPLPVRHVQLPASPRPAPRRAAPAPPRGQSVLTPWPSFAPPRGSPAQSSFMSSPRGALMVAIVCALLIGLAVAIGLSSFTKGQSLQSRVGGFFAAAAQPASDGIELPVPAGGLARLLQSRRWWPQFAQNVEVARISRAPLALVKRAGVGAIVCAVLVTLLFGTPIAGLVVLVLWPRFLRAMVARKARKQRIKFNDQLPSHLQDLAGAMRAGRSIVGAFAAVASSSDEPMRGEFERVVTDDQLGRPLDQSLMAIATRMEAEDMEQVALIASLHRRSGSNVSEALDRVAEGSRDRADMRREIRALTGQARLSSWVLTALPGVLLVAITLVAPKYESPMYHSPVGIGLLVMSGGMVFAGFRVMKRITNVEA